MRKGFELHEVMGRAEAGDIDAALYRTALASMLNVLGDQMTAEQAHEHLLGLTFVFEATRTKAPATP